MILLKSNRMLIIFLNDFISISSGGFKLRKLNKFLCRRHCIQSCNVLYVSGHLFSLNAEKKTPFVKTTNPNLTLE